MGAADAISTRISESRGEPPRHANQLAIRSYQRGRHERDAIRSFRRELARQRLGPDAPVEWHIADLAEPLAFLPDGSIDVVVAPLVLHYLRDWTVPLSEFHRVLVGGGSLVASVHHPFLDYVTSGSENYFALESYSETWNKRGASATMTFWRRPLQMVISSVLQAGFRLDALSEPMPLPEVEQLYPIDWKALTTRPWFLFLRATK